VDDAEDEPMSAIDAKRLTLPGGVSVLVGCDPAAVAAGHGEVLSQPLSENVTSTCVWCAQPRSDHQSLSLLCADAESQYLSKDPEFMAWALHESIKDDWPGFEWKVISNDRAKFMAWRRRMIGTGVFAPSDASTEAYLRSKTT
jgi:hypothetical protein